MILVIYLGFYKISTFEEYFNFRMVEVDISYEIKASLVLSKKRRTKSTEDGDLAGGYSKRSHLFTGSNSMS